MLRALAAVASAILLCAIALFITRLGASTARRIWLVTLTIVLGGAVTMMCAHAFVSKWGFREDNERDGLIHLMEGTADRPFVYRRLSPDIVAATTDLVFPRLSAKELAYLVNDSPLRRYRSSWVIEENWSQKKALAFHVAYLLVWSTLCGALLSMAGLLRTLRGTSWLEAILTASLGMCLLPLMFVNGGYLYDAPELFLWISLLLVAVRGPLLLLVPVFLAMLVNKESALVAVPALVPFLIARTGRGNALRWSAVLSVLGVAWVLYVRRRFAGCPGAPMEWHLGANMAFWSNPAAYLRLGTPYSPILPSPRGGNLILLVFAFIPFRFGWKRTTSEIRWATLLMALAIVPLFLVAGSTDEVRGLSLLLPFLFVVGVEGVRELFHEPAL
jgi:hypothetical protein